MKALLVETDHVIRDRVKVALQQFEGTTVDCAEDAWALELAKENPYDLLVIADHLQEPGDGLRLLRELRAAGLVGPSILLTRDSGDSGARDREAVNVSVVLTVPPDTVDIFKAIVTAQERVAGQAS
jgi:DNA-binding response OmpR family regulator